MSGEPLVGLAVEGSSHLHLPAGTVTFLLSDIESSTRLWAQHAEAMGEAVADSYQILDGAIARHDGVRPVEQGEGDSVVGAFARASDALAAALEAQLALRAHVWPDGLELRVRVALHSADAQLRDEGNYFGLALSRCARLRAIAHGGQTLLSRATHDLVVDALPDGVGLADCGVHRLRDLGRAEQVFALVHPELDGAPPALLSLESFPNNLPDQLSSFVGRAHELLQLRDALGETRLLTLVGAGGAGKTRLALQVAADALERFGDGVWWVELAPVADPELVGEALAAALGVRPLVSMSALEASCMRLGTSLALVVLDNCEHLLEACAEVAERLVRACPQVAVIATSRTPLGVAGETFWRVPSLSLPAPERAAESPEMLEQSDAVRLFVERARKARPGFTVTDDNAPAVARICRELDGLPLAIELAAARLRMMSVEQIAAGLGDRFHLLTGGTRTAMPRQQTLRACVDWSHELLTEPEQTLLRRLSVFAGGFTLDLAQAACTDETVERVAILDLLASLVDQSLVVAEERAGTGRYRLLETVRRYALERLAAAGEDSLIRDRHRDAMLEHAERIAPHLHRPGQENWLDVLDHDSANLTTALERAADTDPERALRLCVALTLWWKPRGLFDPAERGFSRALEAGDPQPSPLRARALWGRGYLAAFAGRIEASLLNLEQAREMAEAVDDQSALARALTVIGFVQTFTDPLGSRVTSERAHDVARACGDHWAVVTSTINLAQSYVVRDEFDQGERLVDEVLPLSEQLGDPEAQARLWLVKCYKPWAAADAVRLSDCAARAVGFARAAGGPSVELVAQGFVAALETASGNPTAAIERLQSVHARAAAAGAGLALGRAVVWLARARAALGDIPAARAALEQVVSESTDGGFRMAMALVTLSDILRIADEPAAAEARASAALGIAERAGNHGVTASAKEILGRLAGGRADWARAETLLHQALSLRIEHDLLLELPQTFDALAEIAAGLDSHEDAARTLGIAARARADHGLVRWPPDAPRIAELGETIRAALGDDDYEHALHEGRELALEDAVTWIRGARGERKRPPGGWESLTPTELRVVAFVAEGLTNPQIGQRMFISRSTVKVHLSHIFAKLDIANRSELAAQATRRGIPT